MLDKQLNKCMCSAIKYLKVSVWRSDWPQQVLVSSFIIYYLEDISCPLAYLRVYYIKMSKYLIPVSASGYCVTNPPADVNIHWLQHKIESVNACIALIHDSCQHFFHGLMPAVRLVYWYCHLMAISGTACFVCATAFLRDGYNQRLESN